MAGIPPSDEVLRVINDMRQQITALMQQVASLQGGGKTEPDRAEVVRPDRALQRGREELRGFRIPPRAVPAPAPELRAASPQDQEPGGGADSSGHGTMAAHL